MLLACVASHPIARETSAFRPGRDSAPCTARPVPASPFEKAIHDTAENRSARVLQYVVSPHGELPLRALCREPYGSAPLDHVAQQLGTICVVPCDRPFRAYPMLVCFCHFQSPELRKHPGVGLVLLCNVADWLPLGLVNQAFSSLGLQAGVVDNYQSADNTYGRIRKLGCRHSLDLTCFIIRTMAHSV